MNDIFYCIFDFDQRIVISYERMGECNNCGKCCEHVIRFEGFRGVGHENNGSPTIYRGGIVNGVCIDGKWRYFHNVKITDDFKPCSMLTPDKRCKIHTGKSRLCKVWPMSPEQASAFSECSYTFRETNRRSMDEVFGVGWDSEVVNA